MKQQLRITFSEFESQVENSYPSIYTREDVLHLLRELWNKITIIPEDNNNVDISVHDVIEAMGHLTLEDYIRVQKDDAEFQISYNNVIELNDVPIEIDTDDIADSLYNELELVLMNKKSK
jgi:hypothetical protein